jgi:hypothetical protein
MRPGQVERHTHDDTRCGITSLFAALDVKLGTIVGGCSFRHRAVEFRRFLDQVERSVSNDLDTHVIMDNAGTHKTKMIRNWSAASRTDVVADRVVVIATVSEQAIRIAIALGHHLKVGGTVGHLTRRPDKANGQALAVGSNMDFGREATARAASRSSARTAARPSSSCRPRLADHAWERQCGRSRRLHPALGDSRVVGGLPKNAARTQMAGTTPTPRHSADHGSLLISHWKISFESHRAASGEFAQCALSTPPSGGSNLTTTQDLSSIQAKRLGARRCK